MVDNKFTEQYLIFIVKAKQDLVLVREVLGSNTIAPEILLFHLQQAVEKLIKSLLTYNQVKFPKTHDLDDLVELAEENNIELPPLIERLTELTPYAVETRYAILHDELHDITEMLSETESFLMFVEDRVKMQLNV
ncbi:MAG TPA: HEPN domain-containing protein [Desulfuromonadales bacterium]|nr:HEPN domain-containing protein [Desulfuromonadales bacterium]